MVNFHGRSVSGSQYYDEGRRISLSARSPRIPQSPPSQDSYDRRTPLTPNFASSSSSSRPPPRMERPPLPRARSAVEAQASWLSMPNKDQLAILMFSRVVDFFQQASIQTYMVHQLKSYDPALPDATISHQAGVLQGAFTAAQIVTSVLWGRAADAAWSGRKSVLLIGLVGTGISCFGVGFATTFVQAAVWRVLGGGINGTVGAARTMLAESVPKQYHSRAFLLLPLAFNIANMVGPVLGSMLVDPVSSFPRYFGPNSLFGGPDGVQWMLRHPYALTNLMSGILQFICAGFVFLYLRETLKARINSQQPDLRDIIQSFVQKWTRKSGGWTSISRSRAKSGRTADMQSQGLLENSDEDIELPEINGKSQNSLHPQLRVEKPVQRLSFRKIWTPNVIFTLLSTAIFDFHMGAFASLWLLFLSTPRTLDSSNPDFIPAPVDEPDIEFDEMGQMEGDDLAFEEPDFDAPEANNMPQRLAKRGVHALVRRSLGLASSSLSSTPFLQPRSATPSSDLPVGGLAFPPQTIGFAMASIGVIGVLLQVLLYPRINARYGLMRCFRASLFLFPPAYFLAPFVALLPSAAPAPDPASGLLIWLGIAGVVFLQVAARTFALPASIILLNNSSPHPSVLGTIHGLGQGVSATFRTLGPVAAGWWFGIGIEKGSVGFAWCVVSVISVAGCVVSWWVRNGTGHEILLPGEEGPQD
ncbi:MAG: hypothetical protein M1822_006486 [Bathelium mastoideum]|nr:MAG: hypothetical protein M1822_006486 [Bathelium mastoideum]